ncbi:hypothetical protein F511_16625 [Dorcoceras hygrometricum]|uniref:Uncharacterized protein n=1 Tax=Dorcoceras hygrometricum TaxID=472368 RepID=A0A2Z7BXM6_9LAMI|nr:hypothetical protein F511_16625 [Dorcoceras hygrometricum]
MKSLELSVEDTRKSHHTLINKQQRQYLDLIRRVEKAKDDLSLEITSSRQLLLDEVRNSSSEINSSLVAFGSQLAEMIAHITRAGDAKRGKVAAVEDKGKAAVVVEKDTAATKDADGFEKISSVFEVQILYFSSCS